MQIRHRYDRLGSSLVLGCAMFAGAAQAQNISGAIFTTTSDGQIVNGNNYDSKLDVYLNGGPKNCISPGLPEGEYYFMVTNPPGSVKLSLDSTFDRKFSVVAGSDGKIGVNLGTHASGTSPCAGGITIQLAKSLVDYADTDNPGGVYKAWITRVADFTAICGAGVDCGLTGFQHSNTKTDNFRVNGAPTYNGEIVAFKFYDKNANGKYDDGYDLPLPNWPMTVTSALQVVNSTHATDANGIAEFDPLVPGNDYFVEEGTPIQSNWHHSATIYSGYAGGPQNPAGPLTVAGNQTTYVAFGNYCTKHCNGKTLGYWSNKNGEARISEADLSMLRSYNLRNADGSHFDPTTYAQLRTWLLNGTATNMAYMLSVQMAAMRLNIYNGLTSGSGFYVPANKTINQIVAAANTSLATYGYTPSGHPQRAYQQQLKNWLDQLNNNAGVLSRVPCPYTFGY